MTVHNKRKSQPSPNEESVLRFLSCYEPGTPEQYAAFSGQGNDTAWRRLRTAWDRKLIYVHHFERSTGRPIPHYAIGGLPDAAPLPALTAIERAKASFERRVADEEGKRAFYDRRKDYVAQRLQTVPGLTEHIRHYKTVWSRNKRLADNGGPSMRNCPLPRPKVYCNALEAGR